MYLIVISILVSKVWCVCVDVKLLLLKFEVDVLIWKFKFIISGLEFFDDEEYDMLNENLLWGDFKCVKRYVIWEVWCKVKCIFCY